jgi:hypothetical protein
MVDTAIEPASGRQNSSPETGFSWRIMACGDLQKKESRLLNFHLAVNRLSRLIAHYHMQSEESMRSLLALRARCLRFLTRDYVDLLHMC